MLDLKSIFSNLPDILPENPRTVIKRYVDAHDEEVEDYEDILEVVKKSHQIDKASGGVTSTGSVEFTVDEDATTRIEEGTVVGTQPDSSGNFKRFITTETVNISSQATYWGNDWGDMHWALSPSQNTITVEVEIESVEAGTEYNVDQNTITYIPDPPPGVVSVTNPDPTTGGKITELDEIGAIYGPLGERGGRTDGQYRSYLKSIVPVFKGRGTIPSLRSVIAAGIGTQFENVEVKEHFQDLEYTLIITDWVQHDGTTVEELADLADASVSKLRKVSYREYDDVGISDSISITEGIQTADTLRFSDSVSTNANKTTLQDEVGLSDNSTVNKNNTTTSDETGIDDSVSTTQQDVYWGSNWEDMHWAVEQ